MAVVVVYTDGLFHHVPQSLHDRMDSTDEYHAFSVAHRTQEYTAAFQYRRLSLYADTHDTSAAHEQLTLLKRQLHSMATIAKLTKETTHIKELIR